MKPKRHTKEESFVDKYFGRSHSIRRSKSIFILSTFIPLISLFLIIRVIPILSIFSLSVTNYHLMRPVTKFVGLANFLRLFEDEQFILAFFNSVEYVLVAVPIEICLGLLFALLLTRRVKFESFYETLYFIPYMLPWVPSTIIWKWFYSPGSFGMANYLLQSVGLPRVPWMSNPQIALLATMAIHIWKNLGYFVVIFVVGLKGIPGNFRDAARLDGATEWQAIRYIVIPLLKPIILFGTIMATMWAWSAFTEIYIMTQAGGQFATAAEIQSLVFRIYQTAFHFYSMGYSSAISLVVFMLSLGFVFIEFKLFKS